MSKAASERGVDFVRQGGKCYFTSLQIRLLPDNTSFLNGSPACPGRKKVQGKEPETRHANFLVYTLKDRIRPVDLSPNAPVQYSELCASEATCRTPSTQVA